MAGDTGPGLVVADRYRLVAALGAGGFGRVWRARDEVLGVQVAVKEVRFPGWAAEAERREFMARAVREARNAALLRGHPNVVEVHDIAFDGGQPWIVMRLVDGVSLDERIRTGGPLSVSETTAVAVGLLRALDAASRAGVTHRDIKPGNVLLAADGSVLLTDFGIAVHTEDTALTDTGRVVGSVEYTAPERARGATATTASDLFSLGATLYHAVEGVSPFRRDNTAATIAALLLEEPPPPRRAGPLTTLITGLLDKSPQKRPSITHALTTSETLTSPAPRDRAGLPAQATVRPARRSRPPLRPSAARSWQVTALAVAWAVVALIGVVGSVKIVGTSQPFEIFDFLPGVFGLDTEGDKPVVLAAAAGGLALVAWLVAPSTNARIVNEMLPLPVGVTTRAVIVFGMLAVFGWLGFAGAVGTTHLLVSDLDVAPLPAIFTPLITIVVLDLVAWGWAREAGYLARAGKPPTT